MTRSRAAIGIMAAAACLLWTGSIASYGSPSAALPAGNGDDNALAVRSDLRKRRAGPGHHYGQAGL